MARYIKYQHNVVQLKILHTKPLLKVSLLDISDFDGPRSYSNYVHIMTKFPPHTLKYDPTSSYLQLPNYKDEQSTVHSQLGIKR